MELKKTHPSTLVRGEETWNTLVSHPCVVDKNSERYPGSKESQPPTAIPGPPAQGSHVRRISPYNFWLQKPVGTELVEETSRVPSSSH